MPKIINIVSNVRTEVEVSTATKGLTFDSDGNIKEVNIAGSQKLLSLSGEGILQEYNNVVQSSSLANVALASNGSVISGTGTVGGDPHYNLNNLIDGQKTDWYYTDGWAGTPGQQFVIISFNGVKIISEVGIFCISNSAGQFHDENSISLYPLVDCKVQFDSSGNWIDIPGAYITNNNKSWIRFTFSEIQTNSIRVVLNLSSPDSYHRLMEIEAFGY